MKKWIFTVLFLAVISFICSAETKAGWYASKSKPAKTSNAKASNVGKGKLLLSVDFEPNVPLKYDFVSERQIAVDLDPSAKSSKGKKETKENKAQIQTEKLEMRIVYKPLQIDPYGFSTIEATCESAKVTRSTTGVRGPDRIDVVESLAGNSFTLKITPSGQVADYNSLEALARQLGEKAFGGGQTKRGRVKNPDMIMDFLATQWDIWDSISSIKKPLKGIKSGNKWNSKVLAPMPFVSKFGRDVEYKYVGVADVNNVSCAKIASTYALSKTPADIPLPYSGSFQMKGMFGFLQGYKVLSIEGTGNLLYDIKKGLIKKDVQQYTANIRATIFGLGSEELEPNIKINQTITMTLVE